MHVPTTRIPGSVVLLLIACLLGASPARGDDADARALLRRVDAATRAVERAEHEATIEGTGAAATRFPTWSGHVWIQRLAVKDPLWGRILLKGERVLAGALRRERFSLCYDGRTVTTQTAGAAVVTHGRYTDGGGGAAAADPWFDLWVLFVHPKPFHDEVTAETADLEGRAVVAGVPCDVVFIKYAGGTEARWYFGRADHLPRRVERLHVVDGRAGAQVMTIRKLRTGGALSKDLFTLGAGQAKPAEPKRSYSDFSAALQRTYSESRGKVMKAKQIFLTADGAGFHREHAAEAQILLLQSVASIEKLTRDFADYYGRLRGVFASVEWVHVDSLWLLTQVAMAQRQDDMAVRYRKRLVEVAEGARGAVGRYVRVDPKSETSAQARRFATQIRATQSATHMFLAMDSLKAKDRAAARRHFDRAIELAKGAEKKSQLRGLRDSLLKNPK